MKITETNCETGETVTRDMNSDEIDSAQNIAISIATEETEAEAKALAKASAVTKLQAIGLTEEEALALLG
jgi:rRNA processing protein Krr1/Pno1